MSTPCGSRPRVHALCAHASCHGIRCTTLLARTLQRTRVNAILHAVYADLRSIPDVIASAYPRSDNSYGTRDAFTLLRFSRPRREPVKTREKEREREDTFDK